MTRLRTCSAVAISALFAFAMAADSVSHLPKAHTRGDLVKYVKSAAAIVQKSGPSCDTFASKEWRSGDYYIIVAGGPDAKIVCHPNESLIGTSQNALVDTKGDRFGEKITKMTMADGKGWIEYFWNRPGQKNEELKHTYAMGVVGPDKTHYTVAAGAWDLKK